MKDFNKSNFLIISTIIILWICLEFVFYHIASQAESEYEKDLIKQANFYYKDIRNTHNIRPKADALYGPNNTLRYLIVSNDSLNLESKSAEFYSQTVEKMKRKHIRDANYRVDYVTKRLHYVHPLYVTQNCLKCHTSYKVNKFKGAIVLDMDASFTLDRTREAWYHFYFVSLLTTVLVFIVFFFISKITRQRLHYLNLNIQLEKKLKVKLLKLNQVLKASGLGYWEWNMQTDEHTVDAQWLSILGLDTSIINGNMEDWRSRIDPDDLRRIMPIIDNAISQRDSFIVEFRMRHMDGHYIWIQGSGGVTHIDDSGKVLVVSGTHQDITNRKLLEIKQKHNEGYLNTLFEKNPNIIIVSNGKKIIKANDAFFRFFSEYDTLETFIREHNCICDFFQSSPDEDFITREYGVWVEQVMASSEPVAKILYLGNEHYFSVHARKVYDEGFMNVIVSFNDITETYRLKKRFEELSIIDELTQIYNRRYFNKIFKDELNRAQREKHSFCFAIMDIDNFKLYNDNYGHDEGDIALKALAGEIQASIKRSKAFFFRLGGEEFGIVFSNVTREAALVHMQTICHDIENLNIEHTANLPSKKLTISIGLCYLESGKEIDLKLLYKRADQALYLAKESGRNRVEIFSPDL